MNGKKFTLIFIALVLVTGIAASLWVKQGYETRPHVKIEDEKK